MNPGPLTMRVALRWVGLMLGVLAISVAAIARGLPDGPITGHAATLLGKPVCGNVSGEWTELDSPITICATGVTVLGDTSLLIQAHKAAVQVKAAGTGGITVYGSLQVVGSATLAVSFNGPTATAGSWAGISTRADTATPPHLGVGSFSYAKIQDATTAIDAESSATSLPGGYGLVASDSIIDRGGAGIFAYQTSISVTGGSITNIGGVGIQETSFNRPIMVSGISFDTIGAEAILDEAPYSGSAVATLTNNTINHAGTAGAPAIRVANSYSLSISGNQITNSAKGTGATGRFPAIQLTGTYNSTAVSLGNVAGEPSVFGNTGTGNGLDAIALAGVTVRNSFSWQTPRTNFFASNPLGYLVSGNITLSAGKTLTLGPDAVVKIIGGYIAAYGAHLVTTGGGVVFTSMRDSSFDGAKQVLATCPSSLAADCTPSPGDWDFIFVGDGIAGSDLVSGDASISSASIRYATRGLDVASRATTLAGGAALLSDSTIDFSAGNAIYVNAVAKVAVFGSRLVNNGGTSSYAVQADGPISIDCTSIHGNGSGVNANSSGTSISYSDLYGNTGANRYDLFAGVATSARHNWWGQASGPAPGQVGGTAGYDASGYLTSQAPTVATALTADNANANGSFGKGTMTVTLTFSRKMDVTVAPTVVIFSPTPHPVSGSWQADGLTWIGTYALDPGTDSAGAANLTTSGARSCVPEPTTNQMAQASKNFVIDYSTAAAVTSAATNVSNQGATFNGSINPQGWTTTGYFEYGTTAGGPYPNKTADQAIGSGTNAVPITQSVSGLSPLTSYYYHAVAKTGNGTSTGTEQSFKTLSSLFFPALMNHAFGGYTTTVYLQNVSGGSLAAGAVTLNYYDAAGAAAGSGDSSPALADGQVWVIRQDNGHSFASGAAGSGRVNTTVPLVAFVNQEIGSSDGSSYSALPDAATGATVFAPAVMNNAYGGYTTGIGISNTGTQSTTVTVTYHNADGTAVSPTRSQALAPNAFWALYQGEATTPLPSGFAGTATITTNPASRLAVTVNEVNAVSGQFLTYTGANAGVTKLYAPAVFNNAYGGYNTGMAIENVSNTTAHVSIAYSGVTNPETFTINAGGSVGNYNGGGSSNPTLPDGFHGSATITSDQPIVEIVNEVKDGVNYGTSYNTFAGGAAVVHLPLVENAFNGFSTGLGVENVGSGAATVTIVYTDPDSGAQIGTSPTLTLQPGEFAGVYQGPGGDNGVPSGTRAAAVLTVTNAANGGKLAVIVNQQSPTSFMSYSGQ